jgi:hypothetical protein
LKSSINQDISPEFTEEWLFSVYPGFERWPMLRHGLQMMQPSCHFAFPFDFQQNPGYL